MPGGGDGTAAKTILLVEDNPDDVVLTMRALKKANVPSEVVVARDGREALDRLFGQSGAAMRGARLVPDLILLDLKLPGAGGLEVLRRLRADARTRLIPVVILTSSNEAHDVSEAYALGANSYVRKPEDFTRFVDVMREIGEYWLALNEPVPG